MGPRTVTTGATRELVEQLSTEHPEFRYEISATGLVAMDVTPPQGRHGSFVADLSAWLVTRYGRGRAATEVGGHHGESRAVPPGGSGALPRARTG